MLDFFKVDRHYRNQFDGGVFTWKQYAKDEKIDRPDEGIDLVAKQGDDMLWGIQCKCYGPDESIDLKAVSTFIAAGNTHKMKRLILVYTGGHITEKAEYHLKKNNGSILTSETLRSASVDWSRFPRLAARKPFELRDYQQEALDNTVSGFRNNDRGQLIMACGTGKTLVSLRVAEKVAPKTGLILYLVPSITLIQQSMRAWSENRKASSYYIGVCSDKSVSGEDGSITELECPVSTRPDDLKQYIGNRPTDKMTVIFCTYNSIQVVADALGKKFIDLALCDEAHRTIGGADQSFFTKIHEDSVIKVRKRLYMTATPKIFTDKIRRAADAQEKKIYAMDDLETYGEKFHELKFYEAVHKYEALSDYKVRIAYIDPQFMDPELQSSMANEEGLLPLSAQNKMVALWHSLLHPDYERDKTRLLQRVIVFSNTINASKLFAGEDQREDQDGENSFHGVVRRVRESKHTDKDVEVRHVDGKTRASSRKRQLDWLAKSDDSPNKCHLLSNARCLSEGVDVPALDGVVFMEPRRSVVDVVQSVGRVMRKHHGKEFGHVILPVAVPAGEDINRTLDDNRTWKVVWEVLNALRSHDPDLAAQINQLVLEKKIPKDGRIGDKIQVVSITDRPDDPDHQRFLERLCSKVGSKMVEKVGDINYYDKYGKQLGEKTRIIESHIHTLVQNSLGAQREVEKLHADLKEMINDSVTRDAAIQVIAQHVVLSGVFDQLFSGRFTAHNPVSKALDRIAKKIGLGEDLQDLAEFYDDVRRELKGITTNEKRQSLIKKIYGNFFESADKKRVEQHGVVYTPVEVIDFIIHSVEHLLKKHFGACFNDRPVKVLDPFTGTGTFLTRLLESNLITSNLYEKYKRDLFADELILLAYYVAAVNIETTYSNLRQGNQHVQFDGISYTDTLQLNPRYRTGTEHRREQKKLDGQFRAAHERIRSQRGSHVHVIIGNPPYSAGQSNFNDENPNMECRDVDKRIADTYAKRSKTHNKNSLYDSYIRSLRWASDRIGDSGIIGFVTNAGFLRSDAGSGIRACLAEEFNDIWCFDLRGNQRTQGETSRREGGKIFGSGSRAPVAITILIKNRTKRGCTIHYKDIGDCLTREQKLKIVGESKSVQGINDWQIIKPDRHHDWLDQRGGKFNEYAPIGSSNVKSGNDNGAIFRTYSNGVKTHRDVWVYNSSKTVLAKNMRRHVNYCNNQDLKKPVIDPRQAKWTSTLSERLLRTKSPFRADRIRTVLYRPFFKQHLYFDHIYNEMHYRIPRFFPESDSKNLAIIVPYKFTGEFSTFITNVTPDLEIIHHGQCFSMYVYEGKKRKENITDSALKEYQDHYNDTAITKQDIFYYVYGLLHHPAYKTKFANNLSRELPHIPMAPDFATFKNIGQKLAKLHLNFDACNRYGLGKPRFNPKKFTKLAFGKKEAGRDDGRASIPDQSIIKADGAVLFENIPDIRYRVNGRTPTAWIVDRYRKTTDVASGITNDPCTGADIIGIIERAVYVGTKSDRLIERLPKEFEPKNWRPKKTGMDGFL